MKATKLRINMFAILCALTTMQLLPIVTATTNPEIDIRALTITVGNKTWHFEALPTDSFVTLPLNSSGETKIFLNAKVTRSTEIWFYFGANKLFPTAEGGRVIEQNLNTFVIVTTAERLLLEVYGTLATQPEFTLLSIHTLERIPILTVRATRIAQTTGTSQLDSTINYLKKKIEGSPLSKQLKDQYYIMYSQAELAKAQGDMAKAYVTANTTINNLDEEIHAYSQALLKIEEAESILTENAARISAEKRVSAETKIKTARTFLENGDYEEAVSLVEMAQSLARLTYWDIIGPYLNVLILVVVAVIALVAVVKIARIVSSGKEKERAEQQELTRLP